MSEERLTSDSPGQDPKSIADLICSTLGELIDPYESLPSPLVTTMARGGVLLTLLAFVLAAKSVIGVSGHSRTTSARRDLTRYVFQMSHEATTAAGIPTYRGERFC